MEKIIELCDISSDDEAIDDVSSTNKIDSSPNTCHSPGQNSVAAIKYTSSNLKLFLRQEPEKYVLVENHKVNLNKPAACWNQFALPAIKNENGSNTIIRGFATCRSCYTTYSHTLGSTKSLNSHKCASSTSSSPSSKSMYFSYYRFSMCCIHISSIKSSWKSRIDRYAAEKKKTLTTAIAKWICESMRPLSLVEDDGFLNIIQQCISWSGGEKYPFKSEMVIQHSIFVSRCTR